MSQCRRLAGSVNRLLDYRTALTAPRVQRGWLGLIYRTRNTGIVETLIHGLPQEGWDIHLWALDGVSVPLEHWTRGTGPGGKFELLQRLVSDHPPPEGAWAAFSDDDFVFRRGGLPDLVAIAQLHGLDVAQPAHRRFVNAAHHITLVRPRVTARRTHFVEIGPLVVMSPLARRLLTPFPAAKMGWGLEATWSRASLDGELRLGIVDGVTIDHLGAVGADYDIPAALAEQDEFLKTARIRSLRDVQTTVSTWRRTRRPWRR